MRSIIILFVAVLALIACDSSSNQDKTENTKGASIESGAEGPQQLLYRAKNTPIDWEAVSILNSLINRYPKSRERIEADALLKEIKERIAAEAERAKLEVAQKEEARKAEKALRDEARKAEEALAARCVFENGRVPAIFKGIDVVEAVKSLNSIKPKDQFETTDSYNKRLREALESKVGLTHCISIEGGYGTEYDADRGTWFLGVPTLGKKSWPEYYVFTTFERNMSEGTYIGENAFGVKRSVARRQDEAYGVALSKSEFDRIMRSFSGKKDRFGMSYMVPVPLPAGSERSVSRSSLRLVIQYKWTPGYIKYDLERVKPTINNPTDSGKHFRYISGRPEKAWIVNGATGEVVASKSLN